MHAQLWLKHVFVPRDPFEFIESDPAAFEYFYLQVRFVERCTSQTHTPSWKAPTALLISAAAAQGRRSDHPTSLRPADQVSAVMCDACVLDAGITGGI